MKFQIGDYVIIRNKIRKITQIGYEYSGLFYAYNNGTEGIWSKNPKPLPIDDALLLKMGFAPGECDMVFTKNITPDLTITFFFTDHSVYIAEYEEGNIKSTSELSGCFYLHQLQRLYELTTDKELKIEI
jgi:hypothetical protein